MKKINTTKKITTSLALVGVVLAAAVLLGLGSLYSVNKVAFLRIATSTGEAMNITRPKLDTVAYDKKMLQLANYPIEVVATSTATSSNSTSSGQAATSTPKAKPWPAKAPYPKAGALLPFNRIIAYYGNFYSKGMGVLGEYPEDVMLQKLKSEVAVWEAADPTTPVIPAIHYIVTTAQEAPQADGNYTLRMPDSQIDKALEIAKKVGAVVFIDFQIGKSTLQKELPLYEAYLALPNVHLGIDPEFSMKSGHKPGSVIGTFDAVDINYAANYLASLVQQYDLPPKVLVIHRFTKDMITNYKSITPLPEVQIVMDMDGWGSPQRKQNTYYHVVSAEPVQFTGFKLFYKNDLKEDPPRMMTPKELLKLQPQPIYIQYQ